MGVTVYPDIPNTKILAFQIDIGISFDSENKSVLIYTDLKCPSFSARAIWVNSI